MRGISAVRHPARRLGWRDDAEVTADLLEALITGPVTPCMKDPEAFTEIHSLGQFDLARRVCLLECDALSACERYARALGPVWSSGVVVAGRLLGEHGSPVAVAFDQGRYTWHGKRPEPFAETGGALGRTYCVNDNVHPGEPVLMGRDGKRPDGCWRLKCRRCRKSIEGIEEVLPRPLPEVIYVRPALRRGRGLDDRRARVSWS
jgi:hypothetical protein